MTMHEKTKPAPKGGAAAALVSAGIGSLFLGLFTTGAVLSEGLKSFLNLYNPAGPLSGKTAFAIVAWLVSWFFLNSSWKDKDYDLNRAFNIFLVLLVIGLILTFPPVFEAFE